MSAPIIIGVAALGAAYLLLKGGGGGEGDFASSMGEEGETKKEKVASIGDEPGGFSFNFPEIKFPSYGGEEMPFTKKLPPPPAPDKREDILRTMGTLKSYELFRKAKPGTADISSLGRPSSKKLAPEKTRFSLINYIKTHNIWGKKRV